MCSIHRAGAALPIFARKRPRVALMAFSNSQNTSNEHSTLPHYRQDRSSVVTASEDKENAPSVYHRSGKETTKWR